MIDDPFDAYDADAYLESRKRKLETIRRLSKMIEQGRITVNTARRMLNLDPIPEKEKPVAFDDLKFCELRLANMVRQQEWDPNGKIDIAYRGNELAGEVGEACNVIKKLARERIGIRGTRATAEQLAEELADAIICVDLIAMQEGIDLAAAVRKKFNDTSEKYALAARIDNVRA